MALARHGDADRAPAQKIFHEDPRIGFLAQARALEQQIADGPACPRRSSPRRASVIFNNRLDAGVTGFFALLILLLLAEAATEWYRILAGQRVGGAHRDALRADALGGGLAVSARRRAALRAALAPPARVERRRRLRDLPRARRQDGPRLSREAFYLDSLAPPLPRPLALLLRSRRAAQ